MSHSSIPFLVSCVIGLLAVQKDNGGARPAPPALTPSVLVPSVLVPTEAAALLYPEARRSAPLGPRARTALAACQAPDPDERIRCLIKGRYAEDRQAALLALRIYDLSGSVAGLEPARKMDGGWRGQLRLVPALPVGAQRRHLTFVANALADYKRFFAVLEREAKRLGQPLRYRWRPLSFRFFRSVGRRTPSAYANAWTVAWNLNGSLLTTARGARETLFHEIFHLNDAQHKSWSVRALETQHKAIVARCTRGQGKRAFLANQCLTPYAPSRTRVQGKTYYAFHPESGVEEYGAELALRYYLEQREAQAGRPSKSPFKCQTPENQKAYTAIAREFFGGVDLIPPCQAPAPP